MARVLAHPFRLAGAEVAKVEDGSDEGLGQLVAVLVTTRRGERPMVPAFGVSDPVFDSYSVAEVNAALSMFGPAVQVDEIAHAPIDDVSQRAVLTFAPAEA